MKFSEILPQLSAKFPVEDHKERQLPGGAGTWYYIPWGTIRRRLNDLIPDEWSVTFDDPQFIGQLCYVKCTLTICGVSRQGIGAVPVEIVSSSGKNAERGNAVERGIAEAFKNAAEYFDIATYLDEQADPKTKADFVRYMQRSGNGKAALNYHRNEGNLPDRTAPKDKSKPFGQAPKQKTVNAANLDRFRKVTQLLSYDIATGDDAIRAAIQKRYPGTKSDQLDGLACNKVVEQLLIEFGALHLGDVEKAEMTFWTTIASDESLQTDEQLVNAWRNCLHRQKQKTA